MSTNEPIKPEHYAESETMSTSGFEDQASRLRDLDGSWEERYAKLRSLALKLKAKIKEQGGHIVKLEKEKENIKESPQKEVNKPQKNQEISIKDVQSLQKEIDLLQDKLEASEKEKKQYLSRLNAIAESITKDKQTLAQNEETITKLQQEIEERKIEKISTDNWKKQIGAKVQTLRKENEANNVLKKEFEEQIKRLKAEVQEKDKELQKEQESHRETKNLLQQSSNENKNYSVLNLEMKDYERGTKELSQKIEKLKSTMEDLKKELESEKIKVKSLEKQNKDLENQKNEEEKQKSTNFIDLENCRKEISGLKETISQKDDIITDITNLLESTKSENEDLSVELSNLMKEHQRLQNCLQNERHEWRNQNLGLQQNLREVQNLVKLKEDTLKNVENDFEHYKIRAQKVLKETPTRDLGLEEKLSEDLQITKTQHTKILGELEDLKTKYTILETRNEILTKEKEQYSKNCKQLESEVENLRSQVKNLMEDHQKSISEHTEIIRNLKVNTETLSQCYRQQILDQEVRHNKEIVELQQSVLEKQQQQAALTPVEPHLGLPTIPREEAEGSESIESLNKNSSNSSTNNVMQPVPLERLLESQNEDELVFMKRQLTEQDSRLEHLTSLLSDTEKDLEKHVQMNKLLKEEIRRQQRSVEREKHAENLEYLKNVLFKFVTLNTSDEKLRLVPVLNTILKLSPEEVKILDNVARNIDENKSWSNYIPSWPGSKQK